jgi:hypothetical protein
VEVDGVSDHELCANAAPAIAMTQVRVRRSFFMGLVLAVLKGSMFWQSADAVTTFLSFLFFFSGFCA